MELDKGIKLVLEVSDAMDGVTSKRDIKCLGVQTCTIVKVAKAISPRVVEPIRVLTLKSENGQDGKFLTSADELLINFKAGDEYGKLELYQVVKTGKVIFLRPSQSKERLKSIIKNGKRQRRNKIPDRVLNFVIKFEIIVLMLFWFVF